MIRNSRLIESSSDFSDAETVLVFPDRKTLCNHLRKYEPVRSGFKWAIVIDDAKNNMAVDLFKLLTEYGLFDLRVFKNMLVAEWWFAKG